eukprot:Amastigsp_a1948_5.p5 type:complete len:101 gc:universal Amastigsp_a1948_5:691-389(-)
MASETGTTRVLKLSIVAVIISCDRSNPSATSLENSSSTTTSGDRRPIASAVSGRSISANALAAAAKTPTQLSRPRLVASRSRSSDARGQSEVLYRRQRDP